MQNKPEKFLKKEIEKFKDSKVIESPFDRMEKFSENGKDYYFN